jgi:hypothetical protein
MEMAVFWVVAPCSLVEVYRRFGGASCLHHQGDRPDYTAITQKTAIFKTYLFCLCFLPNTNEIMVRCSVIALTKVECVTAHSGRPAYG